MPTKRKAQDAFGSSKKQKDASQSLFSNDGVSKPQLSAFAAARAATQTPVEEDYSAISDREQTLVSTIAEAPYDGHHSSRASPDVMSDDGDDDGDDEGDQSVSAPIRPEVRLSTISKASVVRDDAEGVELTLRPNVSDEDDLAPVQIGGSAEKHSEKD